MTIDEMISLLRSSEADAWSVTDVKKLGWQFYFIRHKLDQNRVVNTEHITVTVYKETEQGKYLGSASEEIAPTATQDETEKAIRDLLERAVYVSNPAYELRGPVMEEKTVAAGARPEGLPECTDADLSENVSNTDGVAARPEVPDAGEKHEDSDEPAAQPEVPDPREKQVAALSRDFIDTLSHLPETATEDINSYEIFANEIEKRLVTSTGIDQTQRYPSSMLEVVTNARNEKYLQTHKAGDGAAEIELYRMYTSGACDKEGLARDISRTLKMGKDRLNTVPTPDLGQIPVVFSTADSVTIYQYFVSRMNAQLVYQKVSDWKTGEKIAPGMQGDPLTVTAVKYLPGSSQNFDFDSEGAPIREEVLIEENAAKNYWGNAMFSSYLGLKDTFIVSNYAVAPGAHTEEEIRSGRYLEIVEFSDFQVDAVTGAVFGEIRLGYLHEADGTVTCVSGGSVTGSMLDYVKNMYFSKELVQYDNALVPAVTKLMDVTITGAGR